MDTTWTLHGHYNSISQTKQKIDGQDFSQTLNYSGQWKINGRIFTGNIENVSNYTFDNLEIEANYEFGKGYKEDKSFTDFKILKLSNWTKINTTAIINKRLRRHAKCNH